MSNYTKTTNFTAKDGYSSGDTRKIVRGSEHDTEYSNIATAIATKADTASPTFTGVPLAPTASVGTATTQLATTAFVDAERTSVSTLTNKTLTSPTINGGTITGITDLTVADGGTGVSTLAANAVLLGNGTSALQTVAPGTSGNLLTSNGTTWVSTSAPAGGVTLVSGTAPVVSSGGSTPAISMSAASAGVNGYMTGTYASKLDGIAAGATNVTNTNQLTNGSGFITSAVTSAVAGNGVAVSTSTGSVTFSASCPGFNTVGSYSTAGTTGTYPTAITAGSNYPAGMGAGNMACVVWHFDQFALASTQLSGTWKWMAGSISAGAPPSGVYCMGIACRVS